MTSNEFATMNEIRQAVAAGETVAWRNDSYIVRQGARGFEIVAEFNGSSDPLNDVDYSPADFFRVA